MDIFLARQPIFDRDNRVAAYELLYRGSPTAVVAGGGPAEEMSSSVIVNAFLGIGLGRVTDGRLAYVNSPRELLLGDTLELLDPASVVLEILEDARPDAELAEACERLVASGYRLALDDFVYSPEWEPLIELAETVKIDVLAHSAAELEALVDRLRGRSVRLLAEKVETPDVQAHCLWMGFELFQGYYYSRPETITRRDLAVSKLAILRLMRLVREPNAPDGRIEDAFRADLPLSYKLLRIANSAALGYRGISSIGHAIRLLGRNPLHRWLAVMLVASAGEAGGLEAERAQTSLVRARMCELLGERAFGRGHSGPLFMVGLFSLLDSLLGQGMEEVLAQIDLAAPVEEALLTRSGPYAPALLLAESYEAGRWDEALAQADALELDAERLSELYVQAIGWAREVLSA